MKDRDWIPVPASEQHLQAAIKNRGELLGVLETHLHYLHGYVDLVNHIERLYDLLELFVIRCLLELKPPPSITQIASLLGFEDERFIATVVYRLREHQYLDDAGGGMWRVTPHLREDFTRNQWVEEETQEAVEFRYEWVAHTFLPQQCQPERWERARQLPAETKVEMDEEKIKQWSQRVFETEDNGSIRWERSDIEKAEKWMSPLQVIVHKTEQAEFEWEIFHPFMILRREQHQQLRSIVRELGVEAACQDLLKSG